LEGGSTSQIAITQKKTLTQKAIYSTRQLFDTFQVNTQKIKTVQKTS